MRTEAPYEELRPLLFSIAYRMVSSVSEAEDIVQEAFLRIHRAETEGTTVESPKAYLSAVTTRLSIDHLKSARTRREQYIGEWLPEPLLTDTTQDAASHAETAESLSMAFLVLLESLSPVERAVFLLREVFDYGYDEIARIVDRTEDNCRQLYVRARRHIDEGRPRFDASEEHRDELVERFFAAAERGDLAALEDMLAADVVVYGDGGGKAPSWKPVYGRDRVAKLIAGTLRQAHDLGAVLHAIHVNGQPGMMFLDDEGRIGAVMSLDVADGLVQTIRGVTNPDKLQHLGPVANVREILRKGRSQPRATKPAMEDRFVRQARNEALFREVNERIAELGERAEARSPDGTVDFLCECGDEGGCGQRVRVPIDVYERVRSQDDRFIVRPGHETLEIEHAVEWTDDYVVVDKIPAAEPYVADDPRGATSS